MKLSRKLYLGFAVVIALALVQGVISVISMQRLSQRVIYLDKEYTPELIIAGDIRYEIAMAGYHMRAYITSLNQRDYENGVSRLNTLRTLFANLRELNANQTQLVKLNDYVAQLDSNITIYIDICAQIDGLAKQVVAARTAGDTAYAGVVEAVQAIQAGLDADLERETAAFNENPSSETASQVMRRNQRILAVAEIENQAAEYIRRLWMATAQSNADEVVRVADALDGLAGLAQTFRTNTSEEKEIRPAQSLVDNVAKMAGGVRTLTQLAANISTLGAERLVAFNNVLSLASNMVEDGEADIEAAVATSVTQVDHAIYIISASMLLVSLLGIFASIWIVRSISRAIEQAADQLERTSASLGTQVNLVAGASDELAGMATEQAASLEQTSSALEQVTSMSRQNADNVQRTNEETSQVVRQIEDGAVAVSDMGKAMSEIDDSAEKIGQIIRTIEEIAFQTNLLALNAAVEAARAGEAGKGFAVVADEVRNLAQRSAQAAQETTSLITSTVERVRRGGEISTRLGNLFKQIEGSAHNVGALVDEITTAINEQSQGVDQISTAISQIDSATQQNAENAERVRLSAQDIEAESHAINDATINLYRVVHGTGSKPDSQRVLEVTEIHTPALAMPKNNKMLPPPR